MWLKYLKLHDKTYQCRVCLKCFQSKVLEIKRSFNTNVPSKHGLNQIKHKATKNLIMKYEQLVNCYLYKSIDFTTGTLPT